MALQAKYLNCYIYKILYDDVEDILCYVRDHDDPNNKQKIALPESMLKETVKWFHIFMGQPGGNQFIESLQQRYHQQKKLSHN